MWTFSVPGRRRCRYRCDIRIYCFGYRCDSNGAVPSSIIECPPLDGWPTYSSIAPCFECFELRMVLGGWTKLFLSLLALSPHIFHHAPTSKPVVGRSTVVWWLSRYGLSCHATYNCWYRDGFSICVSGMNFRWYPFPVHRSSRRPSIAHFLSLSSDIFRLSTTYFTV